MFRSDFVGAARSMAIGALALCLLAGCTVQPPVTAAPQIGQALPVTELMQQALVPGMQIAVIRDGKIEVRSLGVTDAQTGAPVSDQSVFEAASLGKPVFAYGVLRLASEGRIDLDAPIGRYKDDLPPDLAALTVRQLLSHSSGLPNSGPATVEPSTPPRFSYSGLGIRIMQDVVERITGEGLQDYMQASVFDPLGMTSSSYRWRDDYADRKAFGHGHTGVNAGRSRITQPQAASSLDTNAADYARFLLAAANGTGLRPDIAREFLRPQVAVEQGCVTCVGTPRGPASDTIAWGLGLALERAGGRTFAWHWGDNETMQSYAAIDAEGRTGVVILTNSANGHSIARTVATSILGTDAPGYAWVGAYRLYTDPDRRLLSKLVREGAASLRAEDLSLPPADLRTVAQRLIAGRYPAEGARLLEQVIAQGKADAVDHALLADALRRSGRLQDAKRAADTALRLAPESPEARQAATRVEQAARTLPPERLRRFAGLYQSPYGPLEIKADGGKLLAILQDQPASDMLPLSDTSFLMEAMGVPIEFVMDDDGIVTSAIVRAGGEIKLPKLR